MAFPAKTERTRALLAHLPLLICLGALLLLVGCTGGAPEATATQPLPTLAAELPTTEAPPTQAAESPTTEPPTQVAQAPTEVVPTQATAEPTEAELTQAAEEPTEAPEVTEVPSTPVVTAEPTQAPTFTLSANSLPQTPGFAPIRRNRDWTPVEQDFDGVLMVMVPAGCFQMGRANASSAEAPEHEQCFDAPFWIDKTEVTNAQYNEYENVAELPSTNRRGQAPRDTISMREAAAFCALRGARLPSEREWEYAASGPSDSIYPWGDEWVANYAVWEGNAPDRSEVVGSRGNGASWVGALDMSGNVWEWTSTIDSPYPYVGTDGRESTTDVGSQRIIRGGSWLNQPAALTTSFRLGSIPTARDSKIGFRCARDL